MAPAIESSRLSERSCRISRRRLAPSAALMAISWPRADVFASISPDRLAHAMSRTIPTAPSNTNSAVFVSPES